MPVQGSQYFVRTQQNDSAGVFFVFSFLLVCPNMTTINKITNKPKTKLNYLHRQSDVAHNKCGSSKDNCSREMVN